MDTQGANGRALSARNAFKVGRRRFSKLNNSAEGSGDLKAVFAAILLMIFGGAGAASADQFELSGKFAVGPTGAAGYTIPIAVPPGTAGMAPSLSLQYSSQQANGVLGLGWTLQGLPSISRCPQTMAQDSNYGRVNYDANDRFCLDGQRLIVISGTYGADGAQYRTERDIYSEIISHSSAGTGPAWFEVHTKAGLEMDFGNTTESAYSQVPVQGQSTARMWNLSEVIDRKGNYYTVNYTADTTNGVVHVSQINYTGNASAGLGTYNSVQFAYTTRSDIVPFYRAGAIVQETQLLTDIKTYAGSSLVSDYKLAYQTSPATARSELKSVTLYDANGTALPSTTFNWQGQMSLPGNTISANSGILTTGITGIFGNFSGHGRGDVLTWWAPAGTPASSLYLAGENGVLTNSGFNAPSSWFGNSGNMVPIVGDWDGDGKLDVAIINRVLNGSNLVQSCGSCYFYTSTGSGFTQINFSPTWGAAKIIVGNFTGNGKGDLLVLPYASGAAASLWEYNGNTFAQIAGFSPVLGYPDWVFVGDFDGDGRTDIAVFNGNSTTNVYLATNFSQVAYSFASTSMPIATGDFNGDGKTDIAYFTGVYLSTGTGVTQMPFTVPVNTNITNGGCLVTTCHMIVGDFNGDGLSDILLLPNNSTAGTAAFLISTGTSFTTISASNWYGYGGYTYLGDVNGDGATDVYISLQSNMSYATAFSPDLISGITTGLGKTTSVTYSPMDRAAVYTKGSSASYPTQDVQDAMYVVSKAQTSNGIGGTYNTDYTYATAQADTQGRGFLGLGTEAIYDEQTQIYDTKSFNLAWPYTGYVSNDARTLGSVTLYNLASTYNSVATTLLGSASPHDIQLTGTTQTGADLDGTAQQTVTSTYQYDGSGNVSQLSVSSSQGWTSVTNNTYNNETSPWILGQLTQSVVTNAITNTSLSPTGSAMSTTRTTNYTPDPATGLLTSETEEPSSSTLQLTTSFTRDAYGNVLTKSVSGSNVASRTTTTTYDGYGRFPATIKNALSQTTIVAYDVRFGGLTSQIDPNNLTTSWVYDTFGRKTNETRPDGTQTNWTYAAISGCGVLQCSVQEAVTGAPTKTTFYDILERPGFTSQSSFDGTTSLISNLTKFDALGRVSSTAHPYLSTAYYTTYTYDALGRVVTETRPDNSVVTYSHTNYLSLGVTNATLSGSGISSETTQTVDEGHGLTISVTDANSNETQYRYEPFDNLGLVTDPLGNKVTMTYDIRGHKIVQSDPDKGSWTYSYDALGELLSRTDALNATISFAYDVLGRPTSETGAVTPNSTWTYDTQAHGIGQLATASTNTGYSRTESYDSYGRPSTTSITVDSTAYPIARAYDSSGRIGSITYPSGQVAGYTYNAQNYLSGVTNGVGGSALWTANQRDAFLHVTQQTYGNNVVGNVGYEQVMGRLTSVQVGSSGALRNLSYTWDLAGRLTSRTDSTFGVTENFGYDLLNRLTSSQIGSTTKTIAYDAVGDITSKSDVGTYSYPASGATSVRPHAVSSITGSINTGSGVVTSPAYTYDANGRMLTGGSSTNHRTFTYAGFDAPQTIANATTSVSFTFDADHQRSKQVAPEGTTIYVGAAGELAEKFTSGSTSTWRNYIMADGERVAMIAQTGSTTTTTYFHQDHLGSVVTLTNASGTVAEQDAYDPWGKRRNTNGSDDPNDTLTSQTTRGYTDQEHLADSALIHMNARVYDPQIGKFTGTDPKVGKPYTTQGWNRYAYVANNPLNSTDPTGEDFGACYSDECTVVHQVIDVLNILSLGNLSVALGGINAPAFALPNSSAAIGTSGSGNTAKTSDESGKGQNQPDDNEPGGPTKEVECDTGVCFAPDKPGDKTTPVRLAGDDRATDKNTAPRPRTSAIRRAWERLTGEQWPLDPKTGRNQDAAHVEARADGGGDNPENIKPQPHDEHLQEHKDNGDFKRWGQRAGSSPRTGSPEPAAAPEGTPPALAPMKSPTLPTQTEVPEFVPGLKVEIPIP